MAALYHRPSTGKYRGSDDFARAIWHGPAVSAPKPVETAVKIAFAEGQEITVTSGRK
jgi:hypothetical protein